jgi:hypothetical protein
VRRIRELIESGQLGSFGIGLGRERGEAYHQAHTGS